MQCMGNSGCCPRGKRAAIVRRCPFVFFPCVQCFRVSAIHRTLTCTTGSLTCARSYVCVYTRGWGTSTTSQHNIFTRKNSHKLFLCSERDSNLWSWNPLNLEAVALPIEPPRPNTIEGICVAFSVTQALYNLTTRNYGTHIQRHE